MSVYVILNDINDELYIGSTKGKINNRMNMHRYMAKNGTTKLANAMRTHGIENFRCELLFEVDPSLRHQCEAVITDLFKPALNERRSYTGLKKENYHKEYYKKYSDDKKDYYAEHKEKIKQYYKDNKEKIISYQRNYYHNKKQKVH